MSLDRDLPQPRLPRSCFRHARAVLTTLGCLVTACGGGDLGLPPGGPAAIRVVDGDGQQASVGGALGAPLVVEVTDADGNPMEGETVEFAFTSAGAGGEIAPPTVRTDETGRAQAHVLLGDKVGLQTGVARVVLEAGEVPTATFSAVAVAGDNRLPRAEFDWLCDDLTCRFTESSSDADGEVAGWAWQFGDGASSTEREPTHRYAAPGTYTVTLTVTDDGGATDESSHSVNPSAPPTTPPSNQAPRAEFDISCQDLRCSFTDRSTDADGSIQRREWGFGDGATSTQRNPSHTYDSPGQYDVVLVVTGQRWGRGQPDPHRGAPISGAAAASAPAVQQGAAGRFRGHLSGPPVHLHRPEHRRGRQHREPAVGLRRRRDVHRPESDAFLCIGRKV